jgi:PPM family protein phosphatase
MDLLTIGAFARASRLSPKALRLYDSLGLLRPAHVDEVSGYRLRGRRRHRAAAIRGRIGHTIRPRSPPRIAALPGPGAAGSMAPWTIYSPR